jgi:hypothetical protein
LNITVTWVARIGNEKSAFHSESHSAVFRFECGRRFNADAIVNSSTQSLFAPEISLGGLHANVTQQELNLLKLATSGMTCGRTCDEHREGPVRRYQQQMQTPSRRFKRPFL